MQAGVFSFAEFDWSRLSSRTIYGDAEFSWDSGSEYGYIDGSAYTESGNVTDSFSGSAPDWTSTLSDSAWTAQAQSSAVRGDWSDSGVLYADAASQPGTGSLSNASWSWSRNEGSFTLEGDGVVLISVPFELSVTGAAGDYLNVSQSSVNLFASYWTNATSADTSSYASLYSADNGDSTLSGTLSVALIATPGVVTSGYLWGEAYAYAETLNVAPEPSSCVLTGIGLGLVGFVAYRRRRK